MTMLIDFLESIASSSNSSFLGGMGHQTLAFSRRLVTIVKITVFWHREEHTSYPIAAGEFGESAVIRLANQARKLRFTVGKDTARR